MEEGGINNNEGGLNGILWLSKVAEEWHHIFCERNGRIFREDIKLCKMYIRKDFCPEPEFVFHYLRMYNLPYFQTDCSGKVRAWVDPSGSTDVQRNGPGTIGRLFIHLWVDKPRHIFSWVYPPNFFNGFIHPITIVSLNIFISICPLRHRYLTSNGNRFIFRGLPVLYL